MNQPPFATSYIETPSALNIGEIPACSSAGSSGKPPRRQSPGKGKDKLSAKPKTANVLLFGKLRELALYRAEVLSNHGFTATIPNSRAEAMAVIRNGGFDAVVLTYTLSSETVEELTELLRQEWPECPLIVITDRTAIDQKILPDVAVRADDGPKALVAALKRLLQGHTSRRN